MGSPNAVLIRTQGEEKEGIKSESWLHSDRIEGRLLWEIRMLSSFGLEERKRRHQVRIPASFGHYQKGIADCGPNDLGIPGQCIKFLIIIAFIVDEQMV
ncbi:hypothetical protein [Bacillus sp. FJAT-27251]|uniref:hypothetical protein n=1 Tax=Bacillus sp. FJAT-27251 TaxID=1684142 RepID=UPI0006A7BC70|nr:hypothetical protein [Bacillus sp. FJAT-27251]